LFQFIFFLFQELTLFVFCHSIAGRSHQNMPLLWKCVCLNSFFICDVASSVKHTLFSHAKPRQNRFLFSTKPVNHLVKILQMTWDLQWWLLSFSCSVC